MSRTTSSKKTRSRRSRRPPSPSRRRKEAPSPSPTKLTPAAIAIAYARDVAAGRIDVCRWVRLACERFLSDLERQRQKKFIFRFDEARANQAVRFIELLPHVKDDFENRAARREKLILQPWQKFIICALFGWVDKKTGQYRFREAYIEVPRKNGKSFLAAGIGLLKFAADGEFGAEVYSGATTEKQAWEIFRPARWIVQRTPQLAKAFGIRVNAKTLVIESSGSRFEPVIGKPGDGASPSCALVDEYHEHISDELVETMRTGMGARRNPLLFQVTTAGSDRSSPCYARHLDAKRLLEGKLEDERLFAIIYTIDEGDDWTKPEVLAKANPNYGVSIEPEGLLRDQFNAVQSARLQNAFKTRRLNIWAATEVGWMNMAEWDACGDPALSLDDFEGEECWIGADLASKKDLVATVKVFKRTVEGKPHYYAFGNYYLNEAVAESAGNGHYSQWAKEGLLTVTPGAVTDFLWVIQDLEADCKRFHVREIPHDPHQAQPLLQMAQDRPTWDQSVIAAEVEPKKAQFTPPMREVEAAVAEKRFHHNGDKIMGWAIANVIVKLDPRDYLYPLKQRPESKIDPAVALFMGVSRAMVAEPGSIYNSDSVVTSF